VIEEVAELGERVAAHARDRRTAPGILGDEVLDDVVTEPVCEIEHIVRNPEFVRDELRVGDGIERAARPVRDAVAVAEQLHGRADDFVALIDQKSRRDG